MIFLIVPLIAISLLYSLLVLGDNGFAFLFGILFGVGGTLIFLNIKTKG